MKTTKKFMCVFMLAFAFVSCSSDDDSGGAQYNLNDIQGKWYRAYSNNPNADGMEVTVTNDQGAVTNPVGANFSLNDIKWKDIVATGIKKYEHQELGSDGSYYNAFMELDNDTLRVYVGHTGAGNEQKWVRTYTEPVTELNECTPYGPESTSGVTEGSWLLPNEEDVYAGLLPAVGDPAGGYYIVTLTSTESTPWIDIRKSGDAVPIINGSNGTANETERKVAISAQPGISYDVRVKPFFNGSGLSNGVAESYLISWEYVGIMDCYEPNNTFAEAKFIPKNQTIEAFANRNNEGYGVQEKFKDFYKVVLDEPSKLQIELLQSPADNFVSLKIFQVSQSQASTSITNVSGNANTAEVGALYKITSNQVLNAGTYYIEAYPYWTNNTTKADFDSGDSLRDSWLTPYSFKVTTVQQ